MACAIARVQNVKSRWLNLVEQHHDRFKKTIAVEPLLLGGA